MTAVQKKRAILIAALALVLLFVFITLQSARINEWLNYILRVLRPVLIGLVVAYLCNPIFRLFERRLFGGMRPYGLRRAISLLFTYIVLFLIFAALIMLIVPQLISSILDFFGSYEEYLQSSVESINSLLATLNETFSVNIPLLNADGIKTWVADFLTNLNLQGVAADLVTFENIWTVLALIGDISAIIADIIIGLFISLYILNSKERQHAQLMRIRQAVFSPTVNTYITNICATADRSFGGFLRGKLLDSTIVGIIVYILISVLNMTSIMNAPYPLLIAVIIGITDIVPVIGPFIGVIPSAIIILLADPISVIPFLLCILVVQQIDGNIIAPKILGDNTGVSSLCVMIAITLLGAVWGLVGMVIAVPLFATVLELSGSFLNSRLRQKGLPVETDRYSWQHVDTKTAAEQRERGTRKRTVTVPLANGGTGTLTDDEQTRLRAYALSKKHDILNSRDSERFAAFAEELNACSTKDISGSEEISSTAASADTDAEA